MEKDKAEGLITFPIKFNQRLNLGAFVGSNRHFRLLNLRIWGLPRCQLLYMFLIKKKKV